MEDILMNDRNIWKSATQKKVREIDKFADGYIDFLNNGKTERECCDLGVAMLEQAGYVELSKVLKTGKKLKECQRNIYNNAYISNHIYCHY